MESVSKEKRRSGNHGHVPHLDGQKILTPESFLPVRTFKYRKDSNFTNFRWPLLKLLERIIDGIQKRYWSDIENGVSLIHYHH